MGANNHTHVNIFYHALKEDQSNFITICICGVLTKKRCTELIFLPQGIYWSVFDHISKRNILMQLNNYCWTRSEQYVEAYPGPSKISRMEIFLQQKLTTEQAVGYCCKAVRLNICQGKLYQIKGKEIINK